MGPIRCRRCGASESPVVASAILGLCRSCVGVRVDPEPPSGSQHRHVFVTVSEYGGLRCRDCGVAWDPEERS